jgi:NDP-sugar pyrophosphorylase family protein
MNGDILSTLNFTDAYEFALKVDANLVVLTKEIVTPFNFGRVISDGNYISEIQEKPDFKLEILAGIYIIKPPVLKLIPPNSYFGIDLLIKEMLGRKMKIARYPIKDYWLDIGQINDFQTAQDAYRQHFVHLKNTSDESSV